MMKRIVSVLVALVLMLGILPVAAMAQQAEPVYRGSQPAESVEKESISLTPASKPADVQLFAQTDVPYEYMTVSQSMVDIIKDAEGFRAKPYWDYLQWTIGYGTVCGYNEDGSDVPADYWDGISMEKAEELLREHIKNHASDDVNYYFAAKRERNYPVSQNMFDAMVDFTYALGASWAYDDTSRVYQYLSNPTTEVDLVRALGAWCRAGGEVFAPACSRRIRESLIFLDGSYFLPWGHEDVGYSDLEVVNDDDLPRFKYTIFDGNGVYMINTRTDDVNYYHDDRSYDVLPQPLRDDDMTFYGWFDDNDEVLLEAHPVDANVEVSAQWVQLPFSDVEDGQWYSTAVAYCYKNDIMTGNPDYTFTPMAEMDRAMMVTTLYRLAGKPSVDAGSSFSDVSSGRYFADAVAWAEQNGIVKGYGDGTFRPEEKLTRAQMVTFLSRYAARFLDEDLSVCADVDRFKDADLIPWYAREAFGWALARGLVNGTGNGMLAPEALANRAQLAKVLMVLANLK